MVREVLMDHRSQVDFSETGVPTLNVLPMKSWSYLSEDITTQMPHMLQAPITDQQAETERVDGGFEISSKLEEQMRDVGILILA